MLDLKQLTADVCQIATEVGYFLKEERCNIRGINRIFFLLGQYRESAKYRSGTYVERLSHSHEQRFHMDYNGKNVPQ